MIEKKGGKFTCPICNLTKPIIDGRPADFVHGPVSDLIRKQYPDWGPGRQICSSCLRNFRMAYVEDTLQGQKGNLTDLEKEVLDSMKEQEILSRNINPEFDKELTFGQRLADRVASFGGSWRFIIIFAVILGLWVIINSIALLRRPFDPYPYILLNLFLSCLAAIQAPIIMMSQNRQESKDRLRAEHDYQVNLKAEIEIRQLHIKLDQLINHSWERLLEIQQIQVDLMNEMAERGDRGKK
jgi:uncharacterized membrane protein